jgi:hypothetical protein
MGRDITGPVEVEPVRPPSTSGTGVVPPVLAPNGAVGAPPGTERPTPPPPLPPRRVR